MGTTAEGCVWDGRESCQDGPGARSKLVREPPAAGDQGLGTSIRQRTDRPHEEPVGVRAARGWAGLPRVLTTGSSQAWERFDQGLIASATSSAGVGRVVFVFHAIAVSFDNEWLPVMHQPVDQGRGQGVVHIKEGAPFPESAIGRQDNRSGFVTGSNHLEQQVGPALV